MLWWFDTNTYVFPGTSFSSPWTSTLTRVVRRISHDQVRAHQWAKYPRLSKRLDVSERVPRTIVYSEMAGIR